MVSPHSINNQRLPNFLIVGAAKGGTTSLYYYLKQHPQVFLSSLKEPCFLCYTENRPPFKVSKNTIFDIEEYQTLFAEGELYPARGEATAIYLYMYENTIKNVKKFLPNNDDLKIIIILRNPVDRAFSQYMMNVRDLRESLSFEEAIKQEPIRKQQNWNTDFFYLDRGMYYEQVKAYQDAFPKIKIYLFEELLNEPSLLMKDLCQFLDIDADFNFSMEEKFNVSGRPKYKFINKLIKSDSLLKQLVTKLLPTDKRNKLFEKIKNNIYDFNLKKEKLNPDTRKKLKEYFKEDLIMLQSIISKDISNWIS